MKKYFYLFALAIALISCGNDEPTSGFDSNVKEVLDVMNGTWVSRGSVYPDTLTFQSFISPTEIEPANESWARLRFDGTLKREFMYLSREHTEDNYFFYVNTDKKQLISYQRTSENKYSIVTYKNYDYTIYTSDSIRLHDTSLSSFNTFVYRKIK